jgi:hypothetical protein
MSGRLRSAACLGHPGGDRRQLGFTHLEAVGDAGLGLFDLTRRK